MIITTPVKKGLLIHYMTTLYHNNIGEVTTRQFDCSK